MTHTPLKCGCCREDFPDHNPHKDPDLNEVVCPDCVRDLKIAKAILARPFDDKGRAINIKGCFKSSVAPDNHA